MLLLDKGALRVVGEYSYNRRACKNDTNCTIFITLYLLDKPTDPSQPLLYYLEEGHKYTHRIAIYSPQELLLNNKLDFVGFISRKLQPGDSQVIEEIRTVDKKLIVELIHTPGLMSYSCRKQSFTSSTSLMRSQLLKSKLTKHKENRQHARRNTKPHNYRRRHYGAMYCLLCL